MARSIRLVSVLEGNGYINQGRRRANDSVRRAERERTALGELFVSELHHTVAQLDVKKFFEELCGEVSRLKLLGDNVIPQGLLLLSLSIEVFDSNKGGTEKMCLEMGVPFLGKVPMDPQLCKAAEEGRSCFADQKCSASAPALQNIVKKLIKTE